MSFCNFFLTLFFFFLLFFLIDSFSDIFPLPLSSLQNQSFPTNKFHILPHPAPKINLLFLSIYFFFVSQFFCKAKDLSPWRLTAVKFCPGLQSKGNQLGCARGKRQRRRRRVFFCYSMAKLYCHGGDRRNGWGKSNSHKGV